MPLKISANWCNSWQKKTFSDVTTDEYIKFKKMNKNLKSAFFAILGVCYSANA